jgi:hypothetical protein
MSFYPYGAQMLHPNATMQPSGTVPPPASVLPSASKQVNK